MQNLVKITILMMCMISLVSAAAPITTIFSGETGFELEVAAPIHIPISTFVNVSIHIFNASNGVIIDPSHVDCEGALFDTKGILITRQDGGVDGHFVYFTLNSTMAEEPGIYPYTFHCNNSVAGGFYTSYFEASTTGVPIETEHSILIIAVLFLFLGVGFFFLVFAKNTEQPGVKLFLNIISYLVIFLTIGASYIILQSVQTGITPLGLGLLYLLGIVFIVIMYYIFINMTRQALALMRARKGFGSELDDPSVF